MSVKSSTELMLYVVLSMPTLIKAGDTRANVANYEQLKVDIISKAYKVYQHNK
jgi:hypothetical protein